MLTIDVGFGALTGRPLALTGARVPAFSAALCSRWTCAHGMSTSLRHAAGALGATDSGFLADRHGFLWWQALICKMWFYEGMK